jgi:hypothetical protein
MTGGTTEASFVPDEAGLLFWIALSRQLLADGSGLTVER